MRRGGSIDVWIVDEDARWRGRLCDALTRTPTVCCSHESRTDGDALVALQHRPASYVLLFDPGATGAATLDLVTHLRAAAPHTGPSHCRLQLTTHASWM